jgi:hypothetical protein
MVSLTMVLLNAIQDGVVKTVILNFVIMIAIRMENA